MELERVLLDFAYKLDGYYGRNEGGEMLRKLVMEYIEYSTLLAQNLRDME